ncbi:MAG: GAF domain-containing sensor histidine kinase [Actinobacteria bacterium]|nr:GAF domain-containing sensor histidine kinase [Actinomycetota bacterium]
MAETTDGSAAEDGIIESVDRVATFAPAILAIRWSTTIMSLALSAQNFANRDYVVVAASVVVIGYTAFRTLDPLKYKGDIKSLLGVLAEVILFILVVDLTGYWESPFIFSLLTAVIVAGFARGFGFAIRVGLFASFAVSIPYLREALTSPRVTNSATFTLVLLLVALIAGYARRISGEADRQHSLALDRLGRLADANALLFSLHRVTQTLPASLDLDDVLDTTINRLRGLFDFDFAAILVFDDTDGSWQTIRSDGTRFPPKVTSSELPAPLLRVINEQSVVNVPNLAQAGPGLSTRASSGLYAVLPARGSLIGLLSIERQAARPFGARDAELIQGFVEPVALAIDNARWFGRLRTVGADEERTRIARDLHDRIGQSLAYLAFELDRIVTTESRGDSVGPALEQLRDDVRSVIREVRDTLYDLRTDVSDSQDLAATLEQFTARVAERGKLDFELFLDRGQRLPILQEREMWRIAQEAITNVERHAHATRVRVIWRCNGESAALDITDNGQGFPIGKAGRLDSYGLLGMRERASSVGATLELTSHVGKGTRVRCSLIRPVPARVGAGIAGGNEV